ncbi:hypothetical protein HWV62_7256 [Athelia sp. TMB]|nr:hypothetical protein HWV62_7256 [Athelia sp. TMB]
MPDSSADHIGSIQGQYNRGGTGHQNNQGPVTNNQQRYLGTIRNQQNNSGSGNVGAQENNGTVNQPTYNGSGPITHKPTFGGAGTAFYSAHNGTNTNVDGDYFNSEQGTQNVNKGAARETPQPPPQLKSPPPPQLQTPAQDAQELSLPLVVEYLQSAPRSVAFLRDNEGWLQEEEEYIRNGLKRLLGRFPQGADYKWIHKVYRTIPKVYPNQRISDLNKLYDAHINHVIDLGNKVFTQPDVADQIGEKLQKFEARAPLPAQNGTASAAELDNTIEKIWELDFVGMYRQKKLFQQDLAALHDSMDDAE